jgi:hypothetical protein
LPDQKRIEVEGTGWFTDRFSPVERIVGRSLRMQMPAWKNNTWGYDTLNNPYGPEAARLFLANSLQFLTQPGQWYLDPARGKLYVRPPDGAVMEHLSVELPRISTLIAIGDNLDSPVENLGFHDIRFSHTTWLGPSSNIGYASQQSGAYLATLLPEYPPDALTSCKWGCPIFEHARNEWHQTPAAIQVAAAKHITFDHNVFAHLGQYALGVGNDANANITGVGLGTAGVFVTRNVFTDLAGGAIQAGGVRRDAHHPRDPRQLNTQLFVINNRIRAVSKDYRDNSAVLSTYVEGATILIMKCPTCRTMPLISATGGESRMRTGIPTTACGSEATISRQISSTRRPPPIVMCMLVTTASTVPSSTSTMAVRSTTCPPAPVR